MVGDVANSSNHTPEADEAEKHRGTSLSKPSTVTLARRRTAQCGWDALWAVSLHEYLDCYDLPLLRTNAHIPRLSFRAFE